MIDSYLLLWTALPTVRTLDFELIIEQIRCALFAEVMTHITLKYPQLRVRGSTNTHRHIGH